MNTFKNTALATLAIATVSVSTMGAATTSAQAGNKFVKGLVAGAIVGGILTHASRRHGHGHGYVRECWYETRKRWDSYGDPYYVDVKVCN